ncbi:MAG TPA: TIGR03862 family flavoprotein [Chthoniobacteraceae bacterium]|nr:TIGR03862 family flavoprotein [Chthoniobacteraceae bacterium]
MIAVVGGGPAGLRAAEVAAQSGAEVALFDSRPSAGRKFLVAGKGGLNLTHQEPAVEFAVRYRGRDQPADLWMRLLAEFGPAELRAWAEGLGIETFAATSGRVYPKDLKAAALLRSWIHRLRALGVHFHVRHRLVDLSVNQAGGIQLQFAEGGVGVQADAAILALGGGSWPETGSDGRWVSMLAERGITVQALTPANCGWEVAWPQGVLDKADGQPLKNVAARAAGESAAGELLVTRYGLEGGVVYQLGSALRRMEHPRLEIDFKPGTSHEQLRRKLTGVKQRVWETACERWRLSPAAQAILTRGTGVSPCAAIADLALLVKSFPVPLSGPRPLAEAISSAGGVAWSELDEDLMLRRLPGVFVAGEMIDWEAPTGGYLLQGAFSTGTRAGCAAVRYSAGSVAARTTRKP